MEKARLIIRTNVVSSSRRYLLLVTSVLAAGLVCNAMELFQVKSVDLNDSKLVATSNYNYAISSPRLLARNWRVVSVNGDSVELITTTGEKSVTNKSALDAEAVLFVERLRDELAASTSGVTSISSGGSSGISSNFVTNSNGFGGSAGSSASFSSSSTSEQMSSSNLDGTVNDMSLNMRDESNFSVSRSRLPFNWARVFYGGGSGADTITFVYKDGEVRMSILAALSPPEREAVERLRQEVKEMQQLQAKQFSQTMQQSVDMVSNVFGNIMGAAGNLPRPPDYASSVSPLFGNNFPFGTSNSPFSEAAGWPFAGSGGSRAFAFAGRR